MRLEPEFNRDVITEVNWIFKQGTNYPNVIKFSHDGRNHTKGEEDFDCNITSVNKNKLENGKMRTKFIVKDFLIPSNGFSSSIIQYTTPKVVDKTDTFIYSIPEEGLPFAKDENIELQYLMIDLPQNLFFTSKLRSSHPRPDSINELGEKVRLYYKDETLAKSNYSLHVRFSKVFRDFTKYILLVGFISALISGLVSQNISLIYDWMVSIVDTVISYLV